MPYGQGQGLAFPSLNLSHGLLLRHWTISSRPILPSCCHTNAAKKIRERGVRDRSTKSPC